MATILNAPRLIYPKFPDPITPEDLNRLFQPTVSEQRWAEAIARMPMARVALLAQLKTFQTLGRFIPTRDIPASVVEHIAATLEVVPELPLMIGENRLYRDHSAIRAFLKVSAWGTDAWRLATATVNRTAEARTDPADLINAAVSTLIRERFELPALRTLRRMAGTAHRGVNTAQWKRIVGKLPEADCMVLDALLDLDLKTQESAFARLCRGPGRASRDHLGALIDHFQWLETLPNPAVPLASIADAKILQWANEARRLNAQEMRRYVGLAVHIVLKVYF